MNDVCHRCAVLGKPISHSLSPVLHMAGYAAYGLDDWLYIHEEVGQSDLARFLDRLDPSWAGLSLTMPLKRTIRSHGIFCDTWSSRLGIANTAILDWSAQRSDRSDDRPAIRLYNTDVAGIVEAFRHAWSVSRQDHDHISSHSSIQPTCSTLNGKDVSGATAVILGNGNTALSALAACTELDVPGRGTIAKVVVCARNPAHSDRLHELAQSCSPGIVLQDASLDEAAEAIGKADVVISTLPAHAADIVAEDLRDDLRSVAGSRGTTPPLLLDVAYDPRPSALQQAWLGCGGGSIGGEEMLLYQAIGQFVLMTGKGSDDQRLETAMRAALHKVL